MRRLIRPIITGVLTLLSVVSLYALAGDRYVIATYDIETILEKGKETLPFNRLMRRLAERAPGTLEFEFYNPARSAKMFRQSDASCLFPASKTQYDESASVVESEAVQIATAHFLALDPLTTGQVLDTQQPGLRIGFIRGNTFGGNVSRLDHHELIALNNRGINIRELLQRGRLDAYLGYLPDIYPIVVARPDQLLYYSDVFYSQNDSFVCHDNPANRKLVEQIDLLLAQMKVSGELGQLLYDKLTPDGNLEPEG